MLDNKNSKKYSIFLNGEEVLRATKENGKKKYYKVVENIAMKPTTKKEFMQTLEKLHNLGLVEESDYIKIKLFYY